MKNIKALRKDAGLSQAEFANIFNVHQTAVSQWEQGRTSPDVNTALQIAKSFNVSLEYVFDKSNSRQKEVQKMRKIQELRKEKGWTQEKLAQRMSVSRSTIAMWESGKSNPDNNDIIKIATLFNISVDDLLGVYTRQENNKSSGIKIPVYGKVAAGIPIDAIEDIIDYEEISEDMARHGEYIALQIKGDSMEPKISNGDVVIVRLQNNFENGDTVIVLVNGDEATCKKIKKTPEGVMLISTNPNYEPMFYTKKQAEELPIRILGKVVELRAKF